MRIFYKLIVLLSSLLLVACHGVTETDSDQVDNKKLTKAAQINVSLGAAYLEKKDVMRAKQKFLLALDQAPDLPEAWYSMAYFYEATGNYDLAKEYFIKAIALAPKRGDVNNNYGTFLCRRGQYQQAVNYFLTAVRDKAYLESSSAYENAGLCALKIPNKTLAAKYFEKALQEDPTRGNVLIESAELHYQLGQYQLAESELFRFKQISAVTPQSMALSRKLQEQR